MLFSYEIITMNQDTRDAIACIDFIENNKTIVRGTGFLVGEKFLLTALHVVADRKKNPPLFTSSEIHLTFPSIKISGYIGRDIGCDLWDREEDWAILSCIEVPQLNPIPLGLLMHMGAEWISQTPPAERVA
jgi:hypothetical protein